MSTDTGTETREPARNGDTPFRYGAALADEIERPAHQKQRFTVGY